VKDDVRPRLTVLDETSRVVLPSRSRGEWLFTAADGLKTR